MAAISLAPLAPAGSGRQAQQVPRETPREIQEVQLFDLDGQPPDLAGKGRQERSAQRRLQAFGSAVRQLGTQMLALGAWST